MKELSIGKLRGLQEISTEEGFITVLALDQRGSLIEAMGLEKNDPDLYAKVRDFKLETISALLPACSAVLLDPQYSAAEAIKDNCIPGQKGLIVATEETGYVKLPDGRVNKVIPDWSLGKAKRMGASAAKLLAYYNPMIEDLATQQENFITDLAKEAAKLDLPLLLEPMSYSSDPDLPKQSAEFAKIRPEIVKTTAERLGILGIDLLKLEFPCDVEFENDKSVWQQTCEKISAVSQVPWVLLSAGVDFDLFKQQLEVACKSGASGFVAGRAIWKEATSLQGSTRSDFLHNRAADRMKELVDIVHQFACPWKNSLKVGISAVSSGWLSQYQDIYQ